MKTTVLHCSNCNESFIKINKEITRRIKKHGNNIPFYCSISCAAIKINSVKKKPLISKICKCGKEFKTIDATYCCRRCASLYTFSELRRKALLINGKKNHFSKDNIQHIASGLRSREWNKYIEIYYYLKDKNISHIFEYNLPNTRYIYDLALFDLKLLIEFDEYYHISNTEVDKNKDLMAIKTGWKIKRIKINSKIKPYPVDLVMQFLSS
ncbi:MAG: hypothetical protein ACD_33C00002G0019 [uncultured bacterium]|nr:MAG: hypothetical protein ACD_33C00002G0019 [uncultured bacterium]